MTDGTGTTSYAYDALGRQTSVTDGAGAQSVATSDDARGGITAITYPDGRVVERDHDALGRLVAVRDWLGNESTFEWDAAGRLVRTVQGNGTVTSRTRDARGDLLAITVTAADREEPVLSFAYERDPLGRVASIREAGRSTTVTRDARGPPADRGRGVIRAGRCRRADQSAWRRPDLRRCGPIALQRWAGGRMTFSDDAAGRRVATSSAAGGHVVPGLGCRRAPGRCGRGALCI